MAEETKAVEMRYKLKPKQWEALVNATKRVNDAAQQLEHERQRATVESGLILEAHGLDADTEVQLDPQTQELIVRAPGEAETSKRARTRKFS